MSRSGGSLGRTRGVLSRSRCNLRGMGRHVLRFLTIHGLAKGKRDPVVYLIKPPKAKGADVTHSVTHTLSGGCIHVSLKNIQSRTRVHKRHEACIKTVPKEVIGKLQVTKIGGPLVLLSRVSGVDDSCGKSATSTVLRILSSRRGRGFQSRCMRLPISLSRMLFVTDTGSVRSVPKPLLSHVRVVRIDDCARGRGFRVTGSRLLTGRFRGGKITSNGLGVASGTLQVIVSSCAERTNMHSLRQRVKRVYHGTTHEVCRNSRGVVHMANAGLRSFLKGPGCHPRGGGGGGRMNVIHNLT